MRSTADKFPVLGPWERRIARRAAGLSLAIAALGWVVLAATDATTGWSGRLARLAALLPVCGALGAWSTLAQARSRGESRALEAIGASPLAVALGAALGGAAVALAAPLLVSFPQVDLAALFPRIDPPHPFRVVGGALLDPLRGVLVERGGALAAAPREVAGVAAPAGGRPMTALALLVAAVGAPAWSVAPGGRGRRLAAGVTAALGAVVAFHLVAAGHVPGAALLLPGLLLVGDAVAAYAARP
jgi:hypothetical protein